jgi:hypothetical protein
MKRKINLVGQNTLTVSLPSKWVSSHNIKKGDEINLDEDGQQLILSIGEKQGREKEIDIKVDSGNWRYIRLILGSIYKKGYTTIRVSFDKEDVFKQIEKSVNFLMGFEIFEHKPGFCLIKCMAIPVEEEYKNTISKIVNTTKTMRVIVKEDYLKGKYERFEEVDNYRNSGWKFRDYAMRIAMNGESANPISHSLVTIVWSIEKINRNYKRLYQLMMESKSKKSDEIVKFMDEFDSYYEFLVQHLHKAELKDVEHLNSEHDRLTAKGFTLLSLIKKDHFIIMLLMENIARIQDMCSSLVMINY